MTVDRGSRIAGYEITGKLGEGGMGEVWRATDTKLKREVAIKVVPAAFAEDAERLARFEREAQLLAQLHHPHIASIFGLEEADGVRALVMELVDGPTLADRMEAGALPLDECLSVARQILEALEEAHEKGIVHRDLKPANVKVTGEGKVKVLDFGLAKAMDTAAAGTSGAPLSSPTMMNSPTLTALHGTQLGVILGTAAYMAPEQARGSAVDRRADLWAFGVVLYEMLTGRTVFAAETVPDTLAAVLTREVDWSALPAETPAEIRRLLRRCLARKPKSRLHSAADARIVVEEVRAGTTGDEFPRSAEPAGLAAAAPPPARLWPLRAGLAALALSTVALGGYVALDRPGPPPVVRTSILPPDGSSFYLETTRPGPIALSPDGRHVAFTLLGADGRRMLWVRALDALEARELPSTENAHYPFWSPDSKQIGFFTDSHLRKIALAGGPPVSLARADLGKGASWSPRGQVVFTPSATGPLFVVPAVGGEAKPLTELVAATGDSSHRHPRFLPDGEHFLFVARKAGGAEVRVGSLAGTQPVPLLPTDSNAEYASGRLLFVRGSTLMAQPFDAGARRLSGDAVPIVEGLLTLQGALVGVFTASRDGALAYQTGSSTSNVRLVWRDREGKELGTLGEPAPLRAPRISPDGRSVAAHITDPESGTNDVWIYDVRRGLRSRFTFDAAADQSPHWSPDGQALAFGSAREGGTIAIWTAPVAGTQPPRKVTAGPRDLAPNGWSPDGRTIVATAFGGSALADVLTVPAGGGDLSPLVATEFSETNAALSPDGRWLAYQSNETGRDEVYVTSFPVPGRKWQISQGEGTSPSWRGDGREVYYRDGRGLYATEVDGTRPVLEIGAVRRLFDMPGNFAPARQYDVTPDGERFLVGEPIEALDVSVVVLVQNWHAAFPQP
ncbi:MAG: serine/threonine-protein kinase [Thermoanaerobaculia bacterium]|nr:serine/threonine-protein kinase [Thermoanaerobaculia bacterium]